MLKILEITNKKITNIAEGGRKVSPSILLVGVWLGIASMKYSMIIP